MNTPKIKTPTSQDSTGQKLKMNKINSYAKWFDTMSKIKSNFKNPSMYKTKSRAAQYDPYDELLMDSINLRN